MKKKKTILMLLYILLTFLTIVILEVVHVIPYFYIRQEYMDLNSGDYRAEKYIFTFKVSDIILKSAFSTEVQRLGIDFNDERKWITLGRATYVLPFLCISHSEGRWMIRQDLYRLLAFYNISNMSDSERIIYTKEALDCMKREKVSDVENALDELLIKLEAKAPGI